MTLSSWPRHGRRGLKGALLGSVTRKVLEGATLPVLVAAVESNLALREPYQQRALALLREEHRSLAAVLQAMLDAVDDTARPPDPALLRAMLFYVEQFPERLHHPKEELQIFALVRALPTSECDGLLTGLQKEHEAGTARFAQLRSLLDAGGMADFAAAAHEFAQSSGSTCAPRRRWCLPAASCHVAGRDRRARPRPSRPMPIRASGPASRSTSAARLDLAGRHGT